MTLPPPDQPDASDASNVPAGSARRWQLPPVWRRRLVIAGGIGLALGLVALASITLVVGDGDDPGPTWEAVAVLDEDSGQITVYDAEGEQVGRTDTGLDDVIRLTTRGEHALVHHGDDGAVALVNLATGDVEELDVDDDRDVEWATTTDAPVAVVTEPDDGDVTLVDAASNTAIDVAEAAGLTSPQIDGDAILSSADGSVFAMTDRNSFQTVLIDMETAEHRFVPPGELVAMSDDTVMTLQRTGQTGDVTFTNLDGERHAPAQVPTPVAVDLVDVRTAVLATADARLLRVSSGDREPDLVIDLAEELTSGQDGDEQPVTGNAAGDPDEDDDPSGTDDGAVEISALRYLGDADRVVAQAGDTVFVLSVDGDIVARFDGYELWRPPDIDDECVTVVSDDGRARRLDARSAEELADADRGLSRSPISSSDDGCTVDVGRSPSTVLDPDRTIEADGTVVELAADGTAALTQPDPGTVELTRLTDDETTPLQFEGDVATFITLDS